MLIFRVPTDGAFRGARSTYERRRPLMRPLAPSEKRRGLVILASAKRLCGYYESGAAAGDEPTHGGSLFEPAKHWFFVFGRTCVLFYDPFIAAMMLFFTAFGVLLTIFSAQTFQRVLAGIALAIVVWQYARIIGEQFGIRSLVKGENGGEKENLP